MLNAAQTEPLPRLRRTWTVLSVPHLLKRDQLVQIGGCGALRQNVFLLLRDEIGFQWYTKNISIAETGDEYQMRVTGFRSLQLRGKYS